MIDKFKFTPPTGFKDSIAYPDNPGNEDEFREQLQRPLDQIREYVNGLVDKYASIQAGTSGAQEIGSEPIGGLMDPDNPLATAQSVRKQIQAVQKNIENIVAGIIPDGSINTQKLAHGAVTPEKVSNEIGIQVVRPRPPINGQDVNYPLGGQWFIPQITLHNLFQNPTFATVDNWSAMNGTVAVEAGSLKCTGGNGASFIKISQVVVGARAAHQIYFGVSAKVNDIANLKKLSVFITWGADTILVKEITTGFVADAMLDLYEVVQIPTTITGDLTLNIQADFMNAVSAQNKIFTIKNPCGIDESVNFSMFGTNLETPILEARYLHDEIVKHLEQTGQNFIERPYLYSDHEYIKINGTEWRTTGMDAETVKLGEKNKKIFGVDNVDDGIYASYAPTSYVAFCANVNTNSLDAAFGKGNEDRVHKIGEQLAMYAWFKGDSRAIYPFAYLKNKNSLEDCINDVYSFNEISNNANINSLIQANAYAKAIFDAKYTDGLFIGKLVALKADVNPNTITNINDVVGNSTILNHIFNTPTSYVHINKCNPLIAALATNSTSLNWMYGNPAISESVLNNASNGNSRVVMRAQTNVATVAVNLDRSNTWKSLYNGKCILVSNLVASTGAQTFNTFINGTASRAISEEESDYVFIFNVCRAYAASGGSYCTSNYKYIPIL